MLREEHLVILSAIYYLYNENPAKTIFVGDINDLLLKSEAKSLSVTESFTKEKIVGIIRYLEEKGLVNVKWIGGWIDGAIHITSEGIDYIEDPLNTLAKEPPHISIASNTISINNTGGDVNIISSSINQRNIQGFSGEELGEIQQKLKGLEKLIENSQIQEQAMLEDVYKMLTKNDKINAAKQLNSLQRIIIGLKNFSLLLSTTLNIYELFRLIFHLP